MKFGITTRVSDTTKEKIWNKNVDDYVDKAKLSSTSYDPVKYDAIAKLAKELNRFCFHSIGSDDNCVGCCFKGENPCPLAEFYNKLIEAIQKI